MSSQGIQFVRGHTYSTTTHSMFVDHRVQLSQLWNEELLGYLDKALLICEMVDPSNSSST